MTDLRQLTRRLVSVQCPTCGTPVHHDRQPDDLAADVVECRRCRRRLPATELEVIR